MKSNLKNQGSDLTNIFTFTRDGILRDPWHGLSHTSWSRSEV